MSARIAELEEEINSTVLNHKRNKWLDELKTFDSHTSVSKLWKTVKKLTSGAKQEPNQSISFNGRTMTENKCIAKAFNSQFTRVRDHKTSNRSRGVRKRIYRRSLDDSPRFTVDETAKVIQTAPASKAFGPDGITAIHLKHLGPQALTYLTELFNCSLRQCIIPDIWKTSTIVPLPKPGKDLTLGKSYRPVSLLSPLIKTLERLLLPALNEHLAPAPNQHGFRAQHSTVTALHQLHHIISDGFNQKKPPVRTVVVALDLSKAFDMVDHDTLLEDLNNTTLPGSLVRWMSCYLHGRQSRVSFRDCLSRSRNIHTGVPQGAVTSPCLFNFYVSQMPVPPIGVQVVSYADDTTLAGSGRNLQEIYDNLNGYIPNLLAYLEERQLQVSAEKSSVTLFTPWTAEVNNVVPQVYANGTLIPNVKQPKILGQYFDNMLTFSPHAKYATARARTRLGVMKALAGTTWGQDKETLVLTYKAVVRPVAEYAAPIWTPSMCRTDKDGKPIPSTWSKLEAVQNEALRIATGCHKMSDVDHLRQETKVLPLQEHAKMLSKQYLASCHQMGHPSNNIVAAPEPPRNMKPTLMSKFGAEIRRRIPAARQFIDERHRKQVIRDIHRDTVRRTVANYGVSKTLGKRPPEVNAAERTLSRPARTRLAQLRSGYSKHLGSYEARITNNAAVNVCPDCAMSPHDVHHIFNCGAKPTRLKVEDLWLKPVEVADFLEL